LVAFLRVGPGRAFHQDFRDHRHMKFSSVALLAVLAAGLSACGSLGMGDKEPPPPCPKVRLLADTNKLVQFRQGPGRDITDVAYEIEIVGLDAVCEFKDKNATVTVTTTLGIAASRGPASLGDIAASVSYFIAVIDSSQQVLGKEVFESRLDLPAGRRRTGVAEETSQRIPLGTRRSSEMEILVGLQLDEEHLRFNRQRRGTP